MKRAILVFALLATAVGYAATGLVVVAPGEQAVVRRLGRPLDRPWGPGLHLGWPRGIDGVAKVRTDEVRRLNVGLAGTPGPTDAPGAGEFVTGDLNLLKAQAAVQYRVADPRAFLVRASAVEPLLARIVEASLTRALSRTEIDATLRQGRGAVAREVEADVARQVAAYGLGVAILGVSLVEARPPAEVADDFAAAQSAQSIRDRRIREGRSYEATALPAAKAAALARTEQAHARAERAVALARSRAGRFLALLAEADRARPLTVRRLYLDTLRELLPKVRRKLLTPDEPIDLSLIEESPLPVPRADGPSDSGR